MTDIDIANAAPSADMAKPATFTVEDRFWGYAILSGTTLPFGVAFGQAVSFFFGVVFAIAALGILLLPALFFDGGFSAMRVGSAALFGAMAAYLLWFASRGTQTEVHVDKSARQIREVVVNRAGKPTPVATYAFNEIGGVFVEKGDDTALDQLILRYRNTSQVVCVAEGSEAQLVGLRDRLGRDLLGLDQAA